MFHSWVCVNFPRVDWILGFNEQTYSYLYFYVHECPRVGTPELNVEVSRQFVEITVLLPPLRIWGSNLVI